jgi:hypothetical protein
MKVMARVVSEECGADLSLAYYDAHWERGRAPLLAQSGAEVCYVGAGSRQGSQLIEEFITVCIQCSGKNGVVSESESSNHSAAADESQYWDGFSLIFRVLASRYRPQKRDDTERKWLVAFGPL